MPGFSNPILPGFYPDPSICRANDDFYLVNSTFEYFPGVPVHHSRDLINWRLIGHCLHRETQLPLAGAPASGGIFAPVIRYHRGTFYMITTNMNGTGEFYVTAVDPAGPWSDPVILSPKQMDPSLLFDDDGRVFYTRHGAGEHGGIYQAELDAKSGRLMQKPRLIWPGTGGIWPEGPHLYKINGWYYCMIAEGGTEYGHSVTIARSKSAFGPFESCPHNPVLTHSHLPDHPIQATGHADLVQIADGSWWTVFLGIRPTAGKNHHLGRETFLAPVTWENDWPVVNNRRPVELSMPLAPNLKPHPWPEVAARDDFTNTTLGLPWNLLRNPYPADWSLAERPGFLRLHGSYVGLGDEDSPAWVGRRQCHFDCSAVALLEFAPTADNEEAGISTRMNERFRYDLFASLRDGKRRICLRRCVAGREEEIACIETPEGPLELEVTADNDNYHFAFGARGRKREVIGRAPCCELSSEKAGGFTGVYFGMYATGRGESCRNPADFDWFDYISWPHVNLPA